MQAVVVVVVMMMVMLMMLMMMLLLLMMMVMMMMMIAGKRVMPHASMCVTTRWLAAEARRGEAAGAIGASARRQEMQR